MSPVPASGIFEEAMPANIFLLDNETSRPGVGRLVFAGLVAVWVYSTRTARPTGICPSTKTPRSEQIMDKARARLDFMSVIIGVCSSPVYVQNEGNCTKAAWAGCTLRESDLGKRCGGSAWANTRTYLGEHRYRRSNKKPKSRPRLRHLPISAFALPACVYGVAVVFLRVSPVLRSLSRT